MKKLLLLLFFLPFTAIASTGYPSEPPTTTDWLFSQVKQSGGSVYFRVKIKGAHWCFVSKSADIAALPDRWQSLAVMSAGMLPLTEAQWKVCASDKPGGQWFVAKNPAATDVPPTRPLKNEALVNKWRIVVGLPCEEPAPVSGVSSNTQLLHATNGAGIRGLTVCTLGLQK